MIEHKLLLLKLGQIRLYINVIQFRPKISQDSSEGDILWLNLMIFLLVLTH